MSNISILSEFRLNELILFENIVNHLLFLNVNKESNINSEEFKTILAQITTENIFDNLIRKYEESEKDFSNDKEKSILELNKLKSIISDLIKQMNSSNFSFVLNAFEKIWKNNNFTIDQEKINPTQSNNEILYIVYKFLVQQEQFMFKYIQGENIITNNLINLIVHLFLVLQIFISGTKNNEEVLHLFLNFLKGIEEKEQDVLIIFSKIEKFINENSLILKKSNNKFILDLEINMKKYSANSFEELINRKNNNHHLLSHLFQEHIGFVMETLEIKEINKKFDFKSENFPNHLTKILKKFNIHFSEKEGNEKNIELLIKEVKEFIQNEIKQEKFILEDLQHILEKYAFRNELNIVVLNKSNEKIKNEENKENEATNNIDSFKDFLIIHQKKLENLISIIYDEKNSTNIFFEKITSILINTINSLFDERKNQKEIKDIKDIKDDLIRKALEKFKEIPEKSFAFENFTTFILDYLKGEKLFVLFDNYEIINIFNRKKKEITNLINLHNRNEKVKDFNKLTSFMAYIFKEVLYKFENGKSPEKTVNEFVIEIAKLLLIEKENGGDKFTYEMILTILYNYATINQSIPKKLNEIDLKYLENVNFILDNFK